MTNPHIPTQSRSESSWPNLRRFLDEALSAPRGIRLSALNGIPLTVTSANTHRNSFGKVRKADKLRAQQSLDPSDPAWGSSPYDALTFIVVPSLQEASISVTWHWPGTPLPWEDWLFLPIEHLPGEARQLASACTITITQGKRQLSSTTAPTFKEGWQALRSQFPATLEILNTYSLVKGDDFEVLL